MLVSSGAFADLCVLKTGDYTLSSKYNLSTPTSFTAGTETETPCLDADSADGATDDSIDLEFSVGSDIEMDVVYQQDPTDQYRILLFNYVMFYDTTNMSIGGASSGDCTPDPAGFFNDNMCIFVGIPCCGDGTGGDGSTPAVVNSYMNFAADKWPADGANFVLDQIVFANTFSQGTDLYDLTFEETGAAPTDVGVVVGGSDTCGIFSGAEKCTDYSVTLQDIMTSKLSITTPPCFIGAPTTASVTCVGNAASCLANASDMSLATADVTLSYTVSTQSCYETSTCDTASTTGSCAGVTSANMGVNFTDLDGTTALTNQQSGTYSDTTTVGNGTNKPSYTLTGVHTTNGCNTCSGTKGTKTVTAATACACGDAPEIALTSTIDRTFYEGSDIKITYSITFDSDVDPTSSIIKFYYTDDATQNAVEYTVTVATEMSVSGSVGTLTVSIPKTYVTEDVDILFGLIVQDEIGLTGTYPTDFAVSSGKIASTTSSTILGSNIKAATAFAFDTGYEPYPNQFPFIPAENGNNLLQIQFTLNAQSSVTMRIYTMDGRLVRQIDNSSTEIGTACTDENCNICQWETGCQWDGTDYQGGNNLVGNGMYIVNIHAVAIGDDNDFRGEVVDYTKGIVVMR